MKEYEPPVVHPSLESCDEGPWVRTSALACEEREAVSVETFVSKVILQKEYAVDVITSTIDGDVHVGGFYQIQLQIE